MNGSPLIHPSPAPNALFPLMCPNAGRCQGTSLTSDIATDFVNCQDICVATAGCMFFTFDGSTGICTLTQDCDTVDVDGCTSCTNGAAVCTILFK